MAAIFAQAQIITHVMQPASLEGGLDFSWADNWSTPPVPDFNVSGTNVQGVAAIGRDSLGCAALTNEEEVAGKICFLWRGECEFGAKALAAQNAGAIACVIVNNQGAPVPMGAGAVGSQVTIPCVMISTDAGLDLYDALIAGELEMFIGNKQEFFTNDVGISAGDLLMPREASTPAEIAMDATEYNFLVGGWVRNWGSATQTNIVLNARVDQEDAPLYDESSTPFDLEPGDSLFVELPDVAFDSYDGLYDMVYTLTADDADEFASDNSVATNFYVGTRFSYGKVDPATLLPVHQEFVQPAGATTGYTFCNHFRDPNASRLTLQGLNVAASAGTGNSLEGEALTINTYTWNAPFTDLSEDFDNTIALDITEVGFGQYFYDEDLSQQNVYIPFETPITLEDNVRYLFCVSAGSSTIFLQYQTALPYDENLNAYLQPITIHFSESSDQWFTGFTGGGCPTIGAEFAENVGVNDLNNVDITPYPNPVNDVLRIPAVKGMGKAQLDIMDVAGKLVKTQQVNMTSGAPLEVQMAGVSNGTYTFRMLFADGTRSAFKVVVNR